MLICLGLICCWLFLDYGIHFCPIYLRITVSLRFHALFRDVYPWSGQRLNLWCMENTQHRVTCKYDVYAWIKRYILATYTIEIEYELLCTYLIGDIYFKTAARYFLILICQAVICLLLLSVIFNQVENQICLPETLEKHHITRFLKHWYVIHFRNYIWRVPGNISRYLIGLQTMKMFPSKEKIWNSKFDLLATLPMT